MEENVWTNPIIHDLLSTKYVVTSLYVDEKTELPKEQQSYSKTIEKQIVRVGDKWTDFQGTNFHEFTQPQYVIIDPQSNRIINKPMSGFNSVDDYKAFLECGLNYKKQ